MLAGEGFPQDDAKAAKWYRLATERGDAYAQEHLGLLYAEGEGVVRDYVQAYMWFDLAAMQGNEGTLSNRDYSATLMTPADISKAKAMAREWMEEHGE